MRAKVVTKVAWDMEIEVHYRRQTYSVSIVQYYRQIDILVHVGTLYNNAFVSQHGFKDVTKLNLKQQQIEQV